LSFNPPDCQKFSLDAKGSPKNLPLLEY